MPTIATLRLREIIEHILKVLSMELNAIAKRGIHNPRSVPNTVSGENNAAKIYW